jgi:hypothetical protein
MNQRLIISNQKLFLIIHFNIIFQTHLIPTIRSIRFMSYVQKIHLFLTALFSYVT